MEDDYYFYDEEKYMISGETLGITYRLGQKIRIRVLGADKLTRTIYFVPEDEQES